GQEDTIRIHRQSYSNFTRECERSNSITVLSRLIVISFFRPTQTSFIPRQSS
ncbi:hypothetical protein M378DRAFT_170484, partial [Amanita muscaria Koide BX008]